MLRLKLINSFFELTHLHDIKAISPVLLPIIIYYLYPGFASQMVGLWLNSEDLLDPEGLQVVELQLLHYL